MEGDITECQYCDRRFNTFRDLHRHLQNFHAGLPNLRILCGVYRCDAVFGKFTSLRSHISRKHRNVIRGHQNLNRELNAEDDSTEDDIADYEVDDDDDENDGDDDGEDDGDFDDEHNHGDVDDDDHHDAEDGNLENDNADEMFHAKAEKLAVAHFILQMRALSNAKNDLVTGFISTAQEIASLNVEKSLQRVALVLQDTAGVTLSDYFDIQNEVDKIDCSFDLDTIYKQDAYFVDMFSMVPPRRECLGGNFIVDGSGICGSNQPIKNQRDEMSHSHLRCDTEVV